jgi:hypothetical protein
LESAKPSFLTKATAKTDQDAPYLALLGWLPLSFAASGAALVVETQGWYTHSIEDLPPSFHRMQRVFSLNWE